jgi:hypothetical protein
VGLDEPLGVCMPEQLRVGRVGDLAVERHHPESIEPRATRASP